jgi:alkanesulfonate monooxygenase SsuD/methylene tetrahydromethanopterin reductase-like flavin-dependent oxidoreductase (luciferase family)
LGADDNPYRATYAAFVVVADTDAQAEKLYADHVEYCFRNGIGNIPIHRLAMPGGISPEGLRALMSAGAAPDTGPPTYRQLAESGAVIAGSPATVRDRLTEYAKAFRIGNLLGFLQVGSMPHELTKHNIDLFSSEVLPHLRPLWSEYDDANRWWPVRLGGRPASDRQAADDGARLR